jgi:predicted peptidase
MRREHKFLKVVFAFVMIAFVVACGSSGGEEPIVVDVRTANDVRTDFSQLTVNEGVNDFTLESTAINFFWNFRIIAPAGASSSNKKPLIIRLHGGASAISENAHKSTSCLVEPGFENLDAYIISPNSNGFFWYNDPNVIQVQALVDMAKQYLHVDTNKVAVMGYSDGGNGSWFFAQFYPQLFSAAIPMASSYDSTTSTGVPEITIPLYVIHGTEDTLFPIATTEGYANASRDAGTDVTFVRAEGLVHNNPCPYVPYLQDAVTWLQTDVWN